MAPQLELGGPDGRNPMGYFAALGTLAALTRVRPEREPRLSWTRAPIPRAILHGFDNIDEVVGALDEDRLAWADSPALFFEDFEDVKFNGPQQREYLLACRAADDGGRSAALAAALVAEGAFAGTGDGKPTDLHFTAGQQRFLRIAQTLQRDTTMGQLREALAGLWSYTEKTPTFGWDVSDDRVYALSVSDPSKDAKYTVPGADWLAIGGIAGFPVLNAGQQAKPAGVAGSWKSGSFGWPLWNNPLSWPGLWAVLNVDAVVRPECKVGVFRLMNSLIRRSDQGGYGSFSPSTVVWDTPEGV